MPRPVLPLKALWVVTVPGDLDFTTTDVQAAQQAVAIIDGITVVSDTNTITDAINGVTLNLNSVNDTISGGTPEAGVDPWDWADPPVYETARMDIKADTGALKEKVTSFVTAYNDVMEWILSGYEEFGGTSETTATDRQTVQTKKTTVGFGTAGRSDNQQHETAAAGDAYRDCQQQRQFHNPLGDRHYHQSERHP